jgi:DNA-binding NtrC family response regulator
VVVQAGPDAGRRVTLDAPPLTIGRGQGEGLQLTDTAVSRHHLTLSVATGADGTSTVVASEIAGVNPVWTLQDGQRVVVEPGRELAIGASLTLGNTTLLVEAGEQAASPGTGGRRGRSTVEMDADVTNRPADPSRLSALAALGDKLARCGSLQAVFREATSWAVNALPATRALLLSPDGSDILGTAAQGGVGDLAMSSAMLHRVLSERRAFLVHDVAAEPDLATRRSVQVRGITGAMAAPASNLVFYAEWDVTQAAAHRHDDEALLLLVCAAHLVSALGESASERSQLMAAAKVRHLTPMPAPRMVGSSAAMQRLLVFIERVAPTQATVLLYGESGTGKELVASMLHALSPRSSGPFVPVNCAAIPESLLESELFGHEKGAFTGAVARHDGVFSRAHTGTLFLDEIGEMSLQTQVRMLRVLETQSFCRVGGTKEVTVDVRLIAATHRDLRQMVQDGTFREDLLYRLSVIHTSLPPLRERADDVPLLVRHFADSLGEAMGHRIDRLATDAIEALQRYRWPGNVRELRNVVERALVLGDGPVLQLDDLPPELVGAAAAPQGSPPVSGPGGVRTLAELEREAIAAALQATRGNKARAAALLGIDRTTLYRKLKDHSLQS